MKSSYEMGIGFINWHTRARIRRENPTVPKHFKISRSPRLLSEVNYSIVLSFSPQNNLFYFILYYSFPFWRMFGRRNFEARVTRSPLYCYAVRNLAGVPTLSSLFAILITVDSITAYGISVHS